MRQFKAGLSPCRIKSASLADVDPFRSRQSRHHVRRNPYRRIGGTRCRNHLGIVFQGYVAKHRKGRRQSERTHATDGMAGHRNDFFRPQHARLGAEMIAEFTMSSRFVPAATTRRIVSPAFRQIVLAIWSGSTPCASAAKATVAELVSVSITVTSGEFSVKNALTDSMVMRIY